MVYRIRKKTIFLFSIIFVGVLSFFSTYIRTNASKDFSLLVPKANADVVACASCGCGWTETQCSNYTTGNGDGCCSGAGPSSGGSDAAADAGACAGACE